MWSHSGQNLPPDEAALVDLRAVSHIYFTGVGPPYYHLNDIPRHNLSVQILNV